MADGLDGPGTQAGKSVRRGLMSNDGEQLGAKWEEVREGM